jgi:hypothetical protein
VPGREVRTGRANRDCEPRACAHFRVPDHNDDLETASTHDSRRDRNSMTIALSRPDDNGARKRSAGPCYDTKPEMLSREPEPYPRDTGRLSSRISAQM